MKEYKVNLYNSEIIIYQDEDGKFIKPNIVKQHESLGTALKPANEPIVLARKPISEKTVALNILKWNTGGINIDGCRVEYQSENDKNSATLQGKCTAKNGSLAGKQEYLGCDDYAPDTLNSIEEDRDICTNCFYREIDHRPRVEFERPELTGRYPANLILTHNPDCTDQCTNGCPIKVLDEQTGILTSGNNCKRTKVGTFLEHGGLGKPGDIQTTYGDSGGASRYFTNLNWDDEDLKTTFLYCAKSSKKERNEGLEDFSTQTVNDGRKKDIDNAFQRGKTERQNTHPTVKPKALIKWLVTLITPPGGTVIDPFAGSGTLGVAIKNTDFNCIMIEKEDEYIPIIQGRTGMNIVMP